MKTKKITKAREAAHKARAAKNRAIDRTNKLQREIDRLRAALIVACDHIDMTALRISHCKDAALIEEALWPNV